MRFILAPHGARLLQEVDERLGQYVVEKFAQRAIDVRLGVGVTAVTERSATLSTGEVIPTRTVIWTGGIMVNPVLQERRSAQGSNTARSRSMVSFRCSITRQSSHWATAPPCPLPTGRASTPQPRRMRSARARSRRRTSSRRSATPDRRRPLRTSRLAAWQAWATARRWRRSADYRLSGLPAWFAWRAIYLAKLPTLSDKVRVGLDWITELFAPVDTVQLPILKENAASVHRSRSYW